jgi:hypothetical protein
MTPAPISGPSAVQKAYYLTILVPMWRGQLDQLAAAERDYRLHLLAVECLRVAKGPGADPLQVAEFCRKWQIPLTLPVIGPTALIRKAGKALGGWPSAGAVFDPTGAINLGVKIVAQMGPLIGQIQMHNALLVAFDTKVISMADQNGVGSILESARSPQVLMNRLQESKSKLEGVWSETLKLAEKMEAIRQELGLPETSP